MAAYLSSFFSRVSSGTSTVKPSFSSLQPETVQHTQLPSQLYRSEAVYELEKRAIFNKSWLLICHEKFLIDTGKVRHTEIAGLHISVFRTDDGEIHAYHDRCSKTGKSVIELEQETELDRLSETGRLATLACEDCSWSSPDFAHLDEQAHCLASLRVHIDRNGFIYVNADTSSNGLSWTDQFGDFDKQDRLDGIDWENYQYDRSWGLMEVPYNWKVLVDNYNECYHCHCAHPGFRTTTDLTSYKAVGHKGHIAHYVKSLEPEKPTDGSPKKFAFNFMTPSFSHTITPKYWHIMRILPTSHRTIDVLYDTFRHKDCTDAEFDDMHSFIVQVVEEDKDLCIGVQKSMEEGVYHSGPLHPTRESGVIHFQRWYLEQMRKYTQLSSTGGEMRVYQL
ncbi:hypothetical protein JCM8547_004055 [Rhodosporidiobolus lusitaniae]